MKTTILKRICMIAVIGFTSTHADTSKTRQTTSTATPSQSYSASVVYPTQVYCPAGYSCAFAAPTFYISTS